MAEELIDDPTKAELFKLLNEAKTRETIYANATFSSAKLAATQVIDKRIEFRENYKKPDAASEPFLIGDIFLDVLVDLVLGGVAGKVLQEAMEGMLRPIIRSRQAYYAIPKIKVKKKKIEIVGPSLNAAQIKQARKDVKKKLHDHFTRLANEDSGALSIMPELIANSATGVITDAASSRINLPRSPRPDRTRNQDRGKTKIVQILFNSIDELENQMIAIDSQYTNLLGQLHFSKITKETADEWLSFLRENVGSRAWTNAEIKAYRENLFRYYEMMMWAHVYDVTNLPREVPNDKMGLKGLRSREGDFSAILHHPGNFKIIKDDEDGVVYDHPGSGYETYGPNLTIRVMRRTVPIPKSAINYLITTIPLSKDDPSGLTVLEYWQKMYGFTRGIKNQIERIRIQAIESALDRLWRIREEAKNTERAFARTGGSGRTQP